MPSPPDDEPIDGRVVLFVFVFLAFLIVVSALDAEMFISMP